MKYLCGTVQRKPVTGRLLLLWQLQLTVPHAPVTLLSSQFWQLKQWQQKQPCATREFKLQQRCWRRCGLINWTPCRSLLQASNALDRFEGWRGIAAAATKTRIKQGSEPTPVMAGHGAPLAVAGEGCNSVCIASVASLSAQRSAFAARAAAGEGTLDARPTDWLHSLCVSEIFPLPFSLDPWA